MLQTINRFNLGDRVQLANVNQGKPDLARTGTVVFVTRQRTQFGYLVYHDGRFRGPYGWSENELAPLARWSRLLAAIRYPFSRGGWLDVALAKNPT